MKTPEKIMEQRRRERLARLNFFMSDQTPPNARTILARAECLNLLEGFFQNSKRQTAWFVVTDAAGSYWRGFKLNCWLCWQYKVMRRSEDDVDRMLSSEGEREGGGE